MVGLSEGKDRTASHRSNDFRPIKYFRFDEPPRGLHNGYAEIESTQDADNAVEEKTARTKIKLF